LASTKKKSGSFASRRIHFMLFILIPIAWLALLTLLVCVCRIAARADVEPSLLATPATPVESIALSRNVLAAPPARRSHPRRPRLAAQRPTARRSRLAAHGIR
jgi:hypothetical protein